MFFVSICFCFNYLSNFCFLFFLFFFFFEIFFVNDEPTQKFAKLSKDFSNIAIIYKALPSEFEIVNKVTISKN